MQRYTKNLDYKQTDKIFFCQLKNSSTSALLNHSIEGTMLATDNVSHPKCEEKRNYAKLFLYVGKKM